MRFLYFSLLVWNVLSASEVDRIIHRNLQARGGEARLRALQTQSMTGTLAFAPNPGESFHVEMKRPHLMRQELSLQGKHLLQLTDGATGWTITQGKPPEPMPAAQAKSMVEGGDIEGPLLDYQSKGNKVEYGGKVTIENRPAHKLIITMKNGDQRIDYIDSKTYLEVKWEGTVGGEKMESLFREYRKVNGVAYAFLIESRGASFRQTLAFDSIQVDLDLPDSRFQKPLH